MKLRVLGGRTLACAATLMLAGSAAAQQSAPGPVPPTLFSAALAEVPGSNLVVVELSYAPNAAPPSTAERHSAGHRHPGSVYVYVVQGAVRLGLEGQPVQVVRAGESFFEPPGALHIINENASATEPAKAIAVMIVPEGQPLVTRDQE
jgi:quercetin dioxygenase-like cupin family protein